MHIEQEAWNIFQKLPLEKQAEVIDFISFLHKRSQMNSEAFIATQAQRHFGCGKGIFMNVSADFDEPLAIFQDYMP